MVAIHNSENNPFKVLDEATLKIHYEDYTVSSKYIKMRDGVKIASTICIPKGLSAGKKIPTLLYQTRYWRAAELRIPFRWIFKETLINLPTPRIFTNHGYAIVYIDVRGCGASYGTRSFPFSKEEIKDGADIADWIISQPWSDGNIVSNGISYPGTTAELLGVNNHPAVKAVMPGHGFWDPYTDVAFPGGCYDSAFMQIWSFLGKQLDNNNAKPFKQLMPILWLIMKGVKPVDNDNALSQLNEAVKQHSTNEYVSDHTKDRDFRDEILPDGTKIDDFSIFHYKKELEKSNIPIISWISWLDSGYIDAAINRFINLENPQICIIGDWNHGGMYIGNSLNPSKVEVSPTPEERITKWIDYFNKILYGEGIKGKTLYYYTMGEEKWKKTQIWPPNGQKRQRWYLTENNSLSTSKPEEKIGEDNYKVNFRATTGRFNRWWTLLGLPIDYSNRTKADKKLLTYTSPPLKENMEITGHPIIALFLSSTHEDGAIHAYLETVDESGNVFFITDGNLRLIHRKISSEQPPYKTLIPYHSFKKKDSLPVVPGEIMEVKFGTRATSALIPKGNRLRIAIAGADKDTFKQYPDEGEGKPTITISRNESHASYIDLPVIPRKNK